MKTEEEKIKEATTVTERHVKTFFKLHPAIDKSKFERQFKLPFRSLRDMLSGVQPLSKIHWDKLISGMEFYGFSQLEMWENEEEDENN